MDLFLAEKGRAQRLEEQEGSVLDLFPPWDLDWVGWAEGRKADLIFEWKRVRGRTRARQTLSGRPSKKGEGEI